MTIWVTGTVKEIVHDTERSILFTITTEEGGELVMSVLKDKGIEVTPGATSTFECRIYAKPRIAPSGRVFYRNHINAKSMMLDKNVGINQMIEAFQKAQKAYEGSVGA